MIFNPTLFLSSTETMGNNISHLRVSLWPLFLSNFSRSNFIALNFTKKTLLLFQFLTIHVRSHLHYYLFCVDHFCQELSKRWNKHRYPGSVYMAGVRPLESEVSLGVIRFAFLVPWFYRHWTKADRVSFRCEVKWSEVKWSHSVISDSLQPHRL